MTGDEAASSADHTLEDHASYVAGLPRMIVAAGALIRDANGQVCVVKPVYKDVWLPPGGTVEAGESPSSGCAREVREEVGLDLPVGRLLCIDWVPVPEDDNGRLVHVYDGGVLTGSQIDDIRLPSEELKGFAFVPPDALGRYLSQRNEIRIVQALRALEQGAVIEVDRLS